ncbi:toll-like receptor 4 isoform X2 [Haliotis rufescens]|uniref:toll-like receptor 4 isoform X2 n=1 Tax=Haliotis rufescens TaxID=6454 RepID=UPI00201F81D6|nr:toll-like receptor 4 isoform X2 [Haliotis rufescens]XP_048236900.1 toll-like receptor 4 isoform X2 [Haliotis rufescens]XP_048236901.1 toll-like receptor 4 isoform X2 [Haliotis rufescens]
MKIICGLILTLTVTSSTSQKTCQIKPDPQLGGSRVDCQNLNLTSVPGDLPPNTVSLDLSGNNITVLRDQAFVRLPRLLYLNIVNSQVSRLEANAFKSLFLLLSLRLNNNNLQLDNHTYPEDVFRPLQSLTELNIGKNDCRLRGTTPDWVFKWLINLETLTIDTFEYEIFGRGFGYLQKLVTLNIGTGSKGDCIHGAIGAIQNHTFSVFENTSVQVLDVKDSKLLAIHAGAYLPFKNISKIVLENVMTLPTAMALRAFYGLNGKNVSQVLMRNSNKYVSRNRNLQSQLITKETLIYLTHICIEHLDLSYSHIIYLDENLILVLSHCIKYLDLSNNNILGDPFIFFQISVCKNLYFLDFSDQYTFNSHMYNSGEGNLDSKFKVTQNRLHTLIRHMPVSENSSVPKLESVGMEIRFPPNLRICMLRGMFTHLGRFFITGITGSSHLAKLDLSYNGAWGLVKQTNGLRSLNKIDLSGNEGWGMTDDFLQSFPNLTSLALNNMGFDEDTLRRGGSVLEGLKTMHALRYLDIVGNDIRYMDMGSIRTLISLNVSRNNLVSVPFEHNDLPDLHILDLSVNSITYFDDDTMDMLESLGQKNKLVLRLKGNPLSCSCQSLLFVRWIFSSSVTFDSNGNYSCVTEYGALTTTHTVYNEFNYHWTSCQGRFWLPVSITLICLIALLLVSAMLVSRNWTRIAHHILVLMGRGIQRVTRQNFNKDAYVAHSDEELQFVMQNLRIGLEDLLGLELILPHRDFLPGQFVADHVVESINKSWKTVLVVSDDFLDDPWSYFIIKSTAYYISNLNPNRVILLMVGNVNRGRLPELLLNVTDEEDIIELDDFPDPHSDVWVHVRDRILTQAV